MLCAHAKATDSSRPFVTLKTRWGYTALHQAAADGHTDVVRMLVRRWGADVDAPGPMGRTACALAERAGHTQTVAFLKRVRLGMSSERDEDANMCDGGGNSDGDGDKDGDEDEDGADGEDEDEIVVTMV